MPPFQPKGELPRWAIVYKVLSETKTGEIAPYESLANALGVDPDIDRHAVQMAVRRASKELEERDRRAVEVVPNRGYRIVESVEHLRLARRHQSKAVKSLGRGQSKVVNVDLSGLDPETRRTFEVVARAFAVQMDFNRRFTGRQEKLEELVDTLHQRSERSEEELAELRARLERLEGSM